MDEWVLVHTGFAIQRVDENEAMEMKKIIDEIAAINAGAWKMHELSIATDLVNTALRRRSTTKPRKS